MSPVLPNSKPAPLDNYNVSDSHPNRIFFFTGAGLSAESGISTFRKNEDGSSSLWDEFDIDVVCNIRTFEKNYHIVHDFYNQRRKMLKDVLPNKAHYLIAELEKKYGANRVYNITTNIDDLLERSGCSNVLHLHGFLREINKNYYGMVPDIQDIGYEEYKHDLDLNLDCVKPNVVFFGEMAPLYLNLDKALNNLRPNKDIFVVIGTSFQVVQIDYMLSCVFGVQKININTDNYPNEHNNPFHINLNKKSSEGMELMMNYFHEFMS